MKNKITAMTVALLVFCMADFLYALDYKGFAITDDFGISFTSTSDAAPSPVNHTPGIEIFLHITDNISFHPALALSWGEFLMSANKAAPAEIEAANAALLLSIILRPYIGYHIDINSILSFDGFFSPTLIFKLPIKSYGQDPSGELLSYYYGGFRLIYPELSLRISWKITEHMSIMVGETTRIPLFRLWDSYPFYDELGLFLHLGLVLK
ncbi:hypothetical protein WKV44_01495 [Spirochaetia bacterium 38H-sp]|uniref:Outer membrane protein beta-barrel domain-containing protein n=1 Tax=Rarispira pelagica TaxID=3141764 RepID=A0ABU9UAM0_9SPIR